jgi:hypothetical protein
MTEGSDNPTVVVTGQRPPPSLFGRLVRLALFAMVTGALAAASAMTVLIVAYSRDLPEPTTSRSTVPSSPPR